MIYQISGSCDESPLFQLNPKAVHCLYSPGLLLTFLPAAGLKFFQFATNWNKYGRKSQEATGQL